VIFLKNRQTNRIITAGSHLQAALAHHQAGQLDEASRLYGKILGKRPNDPHALFFSGLLEHQQGESHGAIEQMRRAIALDPLNGVFYGNLGTVFEETGDQAEAANCYRRAAELGEQPAESQLKSGVCLLKLDRALEAAACFTTALKARPEYPAAVNNLGIALQKMGRLEQAIVCFRRAIELDPNFADPHANLGIPLSKLGRFEEALACCDEALRLDPRCYAAYCNRTPALAGRGKLEEAVESCERAIAIDPNSTPAYLNLGNSLRELGYLSRANECYRRVLELDPKDAGAFSNLGETLRDMGRIAEAAEAYNNAIAAQPEFSVAYSNLLYLHAYTRDISPEAELAFASNWEVGVLNAEERAAARRRASPTGGAFAATPRTGRRLHLGVVSAELGTHAVAEFLQPILENIDKKRFQLTLFPTMPREGIRAEQLRKRADKVVSLVGMRAPQAAEQIRAEGVDVLMDSSGHTSNNRLDIFAHRSAPVQLSYIGYWSTTGLTEMDWVFADENTPAFIDRHFCERLWRLPRVAQCYRGDLSLPESHWQPGETIWLGSFNKYSKMREETFALWGKVMDALPEAKLLLEDRALHEEETHARILAGMANHGVAAGRVEFNEPIFGHERHMMLYDRLDIVLDTVPFSSGTTAYDALWMGVPLVSLEGNYSGGRISSTALYDIGRKEWIAHSEKEYVTIVCALSRDVELRRRLRKTQRAKMAASAVCDYRSLAEDILSALEQMYDLWLMPERR
jgi:predicted O-linked N-acetylglucosamine transferase (SPINDLY family)